MKYESCKLQDLTQGDIARWAELQCADRRYASSFLRPEFSQWLSEVRDDTGVIVVRQGNTATGFLPYESVRGVGHPAGTPLSLCQAMVAEPDCRWDGLALLKAADLNRFVFDYWIPGQDEITPHCTVVAECSYIDLERGFDIYRNAVRRRGSRVFNEIRRKRSMMVRDCGPVVCELCNDPGVIRQLVAWKSEQCRRTHVADVFRFRWSVELLRRAVESGTAACGALLWGLYSGQRLVAVNVLLRSHQFASGWFMAFDPSYARYSPGMILIEEMLRQLPAMGVTRLDMGKGVSGYKRRS